MDKQERIRALLGEAEQAHGAYETTELSGVYDEAWPSWYAQYAVDHGLGAILGHDVSADAVSGLLATSWEQLSQAEPPSQEPWAAYAARRIAGEL